MSIQELFMLLLIFSAVVVGLSMFTSSVFLTYHIQSNFSISQLNKTTEISTTIQSVTSAIQGSGTTTIADLPLIMVTGGYAILKLFITIPNLVWGLFTDFGLLISQVIGFDLTFFIGVVLSMVTVTVIFAILSAIFHWRI